MRILITGPTGFIGSALGLRMVHEGWQVCGAVRSLSDRQRLPLGVEAVPVGSIGPDTMWRQALAGVDIVVHLAARTHVTRESEADPLKTYRLTNVTATDRLAHAAAEAGVRRFIFLSSVKVNGEGRPAPYSERDVPAAEDPYGISKWEAEQVLRRTADGTGMEVVILRPPLVYGAGVKANFAWLMRIIHLGIPLPLASVENRRSLIYLGNLTDAIVTCATSAQAAGKTFLVSDGEDVSTPELIRKIAHALGRPARLVPFPVPLLRSLGRLTGRSGSIEKVVGSLTVDSGRIRRELNWKPPYTMAEGLKETADWFRTAMIEQRR